LWSVQSIALAAFGDNIVSLLSSLLVTWCRTTFLLDRIP